MNAPDYSPEEEPIDVCIPRDRTGFRCLRCGSAHSMAQVIEEEGRVVLVIQCQNCPNRMVYREENRGRRTE